MGMYDNIEFKAPCKKCSETLTDWQSKDGSCTLSYLQPKDVDSFYTVCPKCNTWNEYKTYRTYILNKIELCE